MTEKKRRNIRIKRPQDIRRLLAQTINDVRNDPDMTTKEKADTIAKLSNSTIRAIEQGQVLDRMDRLEQQEQDRRKKSGGALSEMTQAISRVAKTMAMDNVDNDQEGSGQDGQNK